MARIPVPAVLGFFDDPSDLHVTAEKARVEEKFTNLDAYTPYPVHGLEEALDIKDSWVQTAARVGLVSGWIAGFLLQSWTSAVDWPVIIGGKPFISWPAWIPVTFELGVLVAGFTNLISLFIATGMYPRPKTMILSKRITHDRFVLVIPASNKADEDRAIAFLQKQKALKIKVVEGIDDAQQRVVFRASAIDSAPAGA